MLWKLKHTSPLPFDLQTVYLPTKRAQGQRKPSKEKLALSLRWLGYGPEDDMWMPEHRLGNAARLIRDSEHLV